MSAATNAETAADRFEAVPSLNAVVFWTDDNGDTHEWGMATRDNRESRVRARMALYGFEAAPGTLEIYRRPR